MDGGKTLGPSCSFLKQNMKRGRKNTMFQVPFTISKPLMTIGEKKWYYAPALLTLATPLRNVMQSCAPAANESKLHSFQQYLNSQSHIHNQREWSKLSRVLPTHAENK
ncbi:hypothetical protein AVEN_188401-1 [Araneus ventricosus]|uniref:Uncharacterized protein n=1 Tax=Araneus ventricosus TaxID=182803 RepID=A0A4Y2ED89_ARAVE|nr:hypothetical protein AVEN_188401-1 [Araneus ventricosus]